MSLTARTGSAVQRGFGTAGIAAGSVAAVVGLGTLALYQYGTQKDDGTRTTGVVLLSLGIVAALTGALLVVTSRTKIEFSSTSMHGGRHWSLDHGLELSAEGIRF